MNHSFPKATRYLKTIRDFVRFGASCFNKAGLYYGHGTTNAWDEAFALVLHALNLSPDVADEVGQARLLPDEKEKILRLFDLRISARMPVPYIINKTWYADLEMYVDSRVLIPRSPLFETIENQFQPWVIPEQVENILDLCTGSGCIAIACAYAFPEANVCASDLSTAALEVAKINVKKHHLEELLPLYHSDLFEKIPQLAFDIIVSNPPYVDADDMRTLYPEHLHEPRMALEAGYDGLDYVRRILKSAPDYLSEHGILVVEVGNSAYALEEEFPTVHFNWLEFTQGEGEVFVLTKEDLISIPWPTK